MTLPQELIRAKRDGKALSAEDIAAFVEAMVAGSVGDGQVAAFAMAVFFQGMSTDETVALTTAMRSSGTTLAWDLPGPVLDKHSTGGVGDTVSLLLAPMIAACGGFVPMISGRGLGHTGGTCDKMEAIPGYRVFPDLARFRSTVASVGCAIIGQTTDLTPADRRLYAVRDVTATVESIPLITASILAKKLASGLDALVMDVKTGSGAFMGTLDEARVLARSITGVAAGAGLPTVALVTDMDQPLASVAGNALEVACALDYLTGVRRDPRLHEVTLALGAELLVLGGLAASIPEARTRLEKVLTNGTAVEKFSQMIASLGGPHDLVEDPWRHLERAPVVSAVYPARGGIVHTIDTRAVGLGVVALGGGRTRPEDLVDPAVGFSQLAGIGELVAPDRPLAVVHARNQTQVDRAARLLQQAYRLDDRATPGPVVVERITHA